MLGNMSLFHMIHMAALLKDERSFRVVIRRDEACEGYGE